MITAARYPAQVLIGLKVILRLYQACAAIASCIALRGGAATYHTL